jgi:hypothetical protein
MSLTDSDIFNKALSHLNELTKQVSSVTADPSANGKLAQLNYESTRDEELRINRWIFAINRETAVLSTETNKTGWAYVYDVPADSLRVLDLYTVDVTLLQAQYDHENELRYRFKVEKRLIYCNEASATPNPYIKYNQKITDPTLFDVNFVEMLACRLASKICIPVTGDATLKDKLQNEYGALMIRARNENALEAEDDSEAEGEPFWIDRRYW